MRFYILCFLIVSILVSVAGVLIKLNGYKSLGDIALMIVTLSGFTFVILLFIKIMKKN